MQATKANLLKIGGLLVVLSGLGVGLYFAFRNTGSDPEEITTTQPITQPETTPNTSPSRPKWIDTDTCEPKTPGSCAANTPHNRVIMISLDGYKMEYLNKWKSETKYLNKLRSCGVHIPYMRSIFPTKTFPNHYAIATGLYAESHGIVDNKFIDYETGEIFSLGDKRSFWWKGDPIWNTVRNQNKTSAVIYWPGSDVEINGQQPNYWTMYDDDLVPFEERVEMILNWVDGIDHQTGEKINPPDLMMGYFDQPDHDGHEYGPDSEEIGLIVKEMDDVIGSLIEGLIDRDQFNCINLILVADHGMATTPEQDVFYLDQYLEVEPYEIDMSNDIFVRSGASPGLGRAVSDNVSPYNWDTTLKDQCYEALKCNLSGNRSKIFTKQDLPKRLHHLNNDRIPDLQMLMDDNILVNQRPNPEYKDSIGNHGFDNEYTSMHALFLATGNAFQDEYQDDFVHMNVEIYNTIASILNIQASPNNGTSGSLNHLLSENFRFAMQPEKVGKPANFPVDVKAEFVNQEVDSCPAYEMNFGSSEEVLNQRLVLDAAARRVSIETNAPFGLDNLPDAISSQFRIFINKNYIAFENPKMVTFTIDSKSGRSENLSPAELSCFRQDPRTNSTVGSKNNYMYPPQLSNNLYHLPDGVISSNTMPSGISKFANDFYQKLVTEYFKQHLEYDNEHLNVVLGFIYDEDSDGKYDLNVDFENVKPTHFYVRGIS